MPRLYAASDGLLLPTRSEPGGLVALGSSAAAPAVDPQALVGALMSGQAGPVVKALDQQG